MTFLNDVEINGDLASRLSALFRELLEAERQTIAGADDAHRSEELFERGLKNVMRQRCYTTTVAQLDALFNEHIAGYAGIRTSAADPIAAEVLCIR